MPFTKGQSGNVQGDNAHNVIRRAARAEAQQSVSALAGLRDNENAPVNVRMDAATRILALAFPAFAAFVASVGSADQARS